LNFENNEHGHQISLEVMLPFSRSSGIVRPNNKTYIYPIPKKGID
jgi:hypothetical protein